MKALAAVLTCLALISPMASFAQEDVEMADGMRAEGKIYVVVGIILIVLAGLFVYLFLMDRKIGKVEKELRDHTQSPGK